MPPENVTATTRNIEVLFKNLRVKHSTLTHKLIAAEHTYICHYVMPIQNHSGYKGCDQALSNYVSDLDYNNCAWYISQKLNGSMIKYLHI